MKLSEQIMSIPERARRRREDLGLSLRAVAEQSTVGHTAWFRMERGGGLSMDTLILVARWLEDTDDE